MVCRYTPVADVGVPRIDASRHVLVDTQLIGSTSCHASSMVSMSDTPADSDQTSDDLTEHAAHQASTEGTASTPLVGVIMGSDSDYTVMSEAVQVLREFGIAHEVEVVSAHRTPDKMVEYARSAAGRGLKVIIAGAGGAAHLPGMVASMTSLPVIGVPVPLAKLDGLDSLLSIVQMPGGIPVATVSIGGAKNAGLLAARILGSFNAGIQQALDQYAADLESQVAEKNLALQARVAQQ